MRSASVFWAANIAAIMLAGLCGSTTAMGTDHSLSFDGVAQYVTINDPVQITDGPFSIEMWIWLQSCDADHTILCNRHGINGYMLYVYPGGGNAPSVGLILNGTLVAFATLGATTQEWVHVAVTWGGTASGEIKLYADGELLSTYPYTSPVIETPGNLLIGMWGGVGDYFLGLIDDVRIWSVALDQQTIETWMLKPVDASHPNWADLKAYWKFDEGSGQTIASEVNSPDYDGTLGASGEEESADPVWSDVVFPMPVEVITLGRLKSGWLRNAR